MNNIKLVRMQDGSDIIGIVNEIMEGHYVIEQPMLVEVYHRSNVSNISMAYYLPIELVEKNEVVLNSKDIVFITNPTKAFAEYYENAIDRLEKTLWTHHFWMMIRYKPLWPKELRSLCSKNLMTWKFLKKQHYINIIGQHRDLNTCQALLSTFIMVYLT